MSDPLSLLADAERRLSVLAAYEFPGYPGINLEVQAALVSLARFREDAVVLSRVEASMVADFLDHETGARGECVADCAGCEAAALLSAREAE